MPHKKIHEKLRTYAPRAVHKSNKIFSFKYPKLFCLFLSILIAYFLFSNPVVNYWVSSLEEANIYLGSLAAGILLTFGFSAPFSIGFFVSMASKNIFILALLGGVGAMIGDLIIFSTVKYSFQDEFERLKKTKVLREIEKIVKDNPHVLIRHYFLYVIAGILIAAPLPDEIGVSMLAGLTTVKQSALAAVSFVLHTIVIFLILYAF